MIDEIEQILYQASEPFATCFADKSADLAVSVIAASVILIIGALGVKMLEKFLKRIVEKRVGENELLERFIVSVSTKIAWIILLVIVIAKLGVEVGPLIAGLGATGFILGFACQESLGSLAAGIMIAFNQPFKIGDLVLVAGHEGTIRHLDMMAVTLTTLDNRRITIPNKQAWSSAIVNYSAMEIRRIEIVVGISYKADIAKACSVALGAIAGMPEVLRDPAPSSLVKALDDSAVTIAFRAWVKNADFWSAFSSATKLVKEAFDANSIGIPFPQRDVHVIKEG